MGVKVGATGSVKDPTRVASYPFRHFMAGNKGVPGSTDVLGDLGLASDLSRVPPAILEKAAARGTRVHEAIAASLEAGEDPRHAAAPGILEDEDMGFWTAYVGWWTYYRPTALLVEHPFIMQDWPAYGVTLDLFAETPLGDIFVDWKTRAGSDGDGLQTAAAQRAVCKMKPDLADRAAEARRCVVSLSKNGGHRVHWHEDPLDNAYFVAACATWWRKRRQGWDPKKR